MSDWHEKLDLMRQQRQPTANEIANGRDIQQLEPRARAKLKQLIPLWIQEVHTCSMDRVGIWRKVDGTGQGLEAMFELVEDSVK